MERRIHSFARSCPSSGYLAEAVKYYASVLKNYFQQDSSRFWTTDSMLPQDQSYFLFSLSVLRSILERKITYVILFIKQIQCPLYTQV